MQKMRRRKKAMVRLYEAAPATGDGGKVGGGGEGCGGGIDGGVRGGGGGNISSWAWGR